jgi:hypothetical protein
MLYSGICSIAFRKLSVDELIELCAQAKIAILSSTAPRNGKVSLSQSINSKATDSSSLNLSMMTHPDNSSKTQAY